MKDVSLQVESEFEKDARHASSQQLIPPNEPRKLAHKSRRRTHNAVYWFDVRLAQNEGLKFWQTINNAIIWYDSMPADGLVKVVKRNLDGTEAENLYDKGEYLNEEMFPAEYYRKK